MSGGSNPDQASVLAVILALGAADDLCAPLAGHPLITYSAAAALQAASVSHILVAGNPRLAEVVRHYVNSYSLSPTQVETLPMPSEAHYDEASLAHAIDHWNCHHSGPYMELSVILRADWPLHPRGALEDAIQVFRHNPQAVEAVSLVPTGLNNRWWAPCASGALVRLSTAPDQPESQLSGARREGARVYVETGHFTIIRSASEKNDGAGLSNRRGVAASIASNPLPVVLDPRFGVRVVGPVEWRWAEWQVQFGDLDMVYPGTHPRPFPEKVALLVMDFDGVLTDNRVWVDEEGHEHIAANRSDSLGLSFLRRAGVEALVISMETNPVVSARCHKMKVPVLQGINDKAAVLSQYMAERSFDPAQVVYLGNDVNDLVCFPMVGYAAAVADSLPVVLRQADLVLANRGGHAAVRELCDLILLRAGK